MMPDAVPSWLKTMRDITGTAETPGDADNPVILSWRDEIARRFPDMRDYCNLYDHDSTAWCGLTVAYCMAHNGIRPVFGPEETDKFLWAQAWKQFGRKVETPELGDVLVLAVHVTLYDGMEGDYYRCRGGNQPGDEVNVTLVAKSEIQYIRRPPAPVSKTQATSPAVVLDSPRRFAAITATVFGGSSDPNRSAYDGHVISDSEFGVALPARIENPRPKVRVYKGDKAVECTIVDVGPWNINDPYWTTGTRPQAETGIDRSGRPTNMAGIDLTPAAADAIGVSGKGEVDWEFVGPMAGTKPSQPSMPSDYRLAKLEALLRQLLGQGVDAASAGSSSTDTAQDGSVSYGDEGSRVSVLQQALVDAGYSLGDVDGEFGALTLTALKAFQADNGLPVTGVPDGATWLALNRAPYRPRTDSDVAMGQADPQNGGVVNLPDIQASQDSLQKFLPVLLMLLLKPNMGALDKGKAAPTLEVILPLLLQAALSGKPVDLAQLVAALTTGKPGVAQAPAATPTTGSGQVPANQPADLISLLIPFLYQRLTHKPWPGATQDTDALSNPNTPALSRPSVQLSAGALGIATLLQALGIIGMPFGLQGGPEAPSHVATLSTLIPLITGAVGATGGWGAIGDILSKIFGGFAGK